MRREAVYVRCGGKGTAPGCALYRSPKVPSVRPILSELIGAGAETWEVNRSRAPSGPVKAVVSQQPHVRHHAGIKVHAGISALFAWFPASWASKIAPVFVGSEGSKISPQVINIPCPNRACDGAQNTAEALALQAVRFIDKNVVGLALGIEDEFLNANSFPELLRGYTSGVIAPYMMRGLLPVSAIRVSLDVIVPSPKGLTPEKWKQTATLCPLDWPSNYSLLRLWQSSWRHLLSKCNTAICLRPGLLTMGSL